MVQIVSFPRIPGFTTGGSATNLFGLWDRPVGDYPAVLWPRGRLTDIESSPSGWVTVEEHFHTPYEHGGRGCVLVDRDCHSDALRGTSWLGRDLGTFSVWEAPEGGSGFQNGLVSDQARTRTEFFVQARNATGTSLPQIEVSLPFLWFWDAFEFPNGWHYVNAAGREQELVRYQRSADSWTVDVRVEEFRTFLSACRKSALLQVDYVMKVADGDFDRVDSDFQNDWAHVDFHAVADFLTGSDYPSMSRICGQYILAGQDTPRRPRWEEFHSATEYPEFIYGSDPKTGAHLTHTCEPNELGTYFDQDDSRLHYLTPIYFRRSVLQDYVAEPTRYEVTPFHLSCFNLWGIDISINTVGLVEVYLGDIGSKLPHEEWGHWRSYNVPPDGEMEEGRFRRDFYNQAVPSPDPIGEMRRAREAANEAARGLLGGDLWRSLPSDLELQYRSLMGPLTDDPSALVVPLLIVAKVFVDGLDSKLLKNAVGGSEKGEKSLALLGRLLTSRGDADDSTKVLRDLYAIRSRGGVAHLHNSESTAVLAELGIDTLPPIPAFEKVIRQVGTAVTRIGDLLGGEKQIGESNGGART
ncbi:hypothetical protein QRB36_06345 [Mycobacterium marseillense]|uniref:hypothetical protein n=1 Tax=Mycobacterium marseillense TaxID=701042 RepID=UPI0025985EB6|nr:hypothetical protein [Mycobacterium marseillense]MDM3973782.1 hypothetical protein [Mycobacterium marseillense]